MRQPTGQYTVGLPLTEEFDDGTFDVTSPWPALPGKWTLQMPRTEVFSGGGLDGDCSDAMILRECVFENVYRIRPDMFSDSKLIVDVGANVGYFTLFCLACVPDSHVIAIEPEPANLEILKNNITLNGWEDRVTILPKAASVVDGTVFLEGVGGVARASSEVESGVSVPCFNFPKYLATLGQIAYLKCDIEGGEYEALPPVDWSNIDNLGMEYHICDPEDFGVIVSSFANDLHGEWIGFPRTGGQLWATRS